MGHKNIKYNSKIDNENEKNEKKLVIKQSGIKVKYKKSKVAENKTDDKKIFSAFFAVQTENILALW